MHVHRKTLYLGVFLIAMGAVVLVAQGGIVDDATVTRALGLWPLVVIALGAALVLRGTRLGLAGGLVAAALPGLLFGGLVVAAPDVGFDCRHELPVATEVRDGTFRGRAEVDLVLSCGELRLTTGSGTGWRVESGHSGPIAPAIASSDEGLSVRSSGRDGRFWVDGEAESWAVTLPTAVVMDLAVEVSAGRATVDLTDARLGRLDLAINAGDFDLDLTGAVLDRLEIEANAADAAVRLPVADFSAEISANAANVDLCIPAGLGVRFSEDLDLGSVSRDDLVRVGNGWQTLDYETAAHRADVSLSINVGSVHIDPAGGCK